MLLQGRAPMAGAWRVVASIALNGRWQGPGDVCGELGALDATLRVQRQEGVLFQTEKVRVMRRWWID
jgi:hypothetical protein